MLLGTPDGLQVATSGPKLPSGRIAWMWEKIRNIFFDTLNNRKTFLMFGTHPQQGVTSK